MRVENRINDMSFKTSQVQNKNFEKATVETKNVKENETVQKVAAEKNLKTPEVKIERKDVVNSKIKTNEQFKTYTKDGSFEEIQLQEASEVDVKV